MRGGLRHITAVLVVLGIAACGTFLDTGNDPPPVDTSNAGNATADGGPAPGDDAALGGVAECEVLPPGSECSRGLCFPDGSCSPRLADGQPCDVTWQCASGVCKRSRDGVDGGPPSGECVPVKEAGCEYPGLVPESASCTCCLGALCVARPLGPNGSCELCAIGGQACVEEPNRKKGQACCEGYRCENAVCVLGSSVTE
ncbi:MAG: hypothetical protein KIT84_17125 [Labilithrix sp.]|nr:hypothetical protein [Labilithrix sp.]MCW5812753.1 hypothetical protein [Labilithrix sp.]